MPTKPLTAPHMAGGYIPAFGEKNVPMEAIFEGQNCRANQQGGLFHRAGYQDTEVNLKTGISGFTPTAGRGLGSAKGIPLAWIALDDGTNVRILYADISAKTVYDTGITLTTGKNVFFLEWYNAIYYANGTDPLGKIMVGTLASLVTAGDTSATLTTGHGTRFPTGAFTGYCEGDVFTSTGVSGESVAGVPASGANSFNSNHAAGQVIVTSTTITAQTYQANPKFLAEWLSSLNMGGDPDAPYTWEYSKFALASDLTEFEDFSADPAGAELVGDGGILSAFLPTKNFFYVWKKRGGIHYVERSNVDESTGARIPQPLTSRFGVPNERCVDDMNGEAIFQTTDKRITPIRIITEDVKQTVAVDANFDQNIRPYMRATDDPDDTNFTMFSEDDQLARFGVKRNNGVREILPYDAELGIFYPKDTGKPYSHMVAHEGKVYGLDDEGQYLFEDETGNYDFDAPIDFEAETGRIGSEFLRAAWRYVYVHGFMKIGSTAKVEVFIGGKRQFTKTLTDAYLTSTAAEDAKPIGGGDVGRISIGGGVVSDDTFPFEFPIRFYKHGQDMKIKLSYSTENGNFVQFDGYTFGVQPRSKVPQKHA